MKNDLFNIAGVQDLTTTETKNTNGGLSVWYYIGYVIGAGVRADAEASMRQYSGNPYP